jgi:hypothetical protein
MIVYPIYFLSGGVFSAEPFLTNGACRTVGTTPPALYEFLAHSSEPQFPVSPTRIPFYGARRYGNFWGTLLLHRGVFRHRLGGQWGFR